MWASRSARRDTVAIRVPVIALVKIVATALFFIAAFMGVPLLIMGTATAVTSWLGSAWYVGLLLGTVLLVEFCGGLSFSLWAGPRVGDWCFSAPVADGRQETQEARSGQ